MKLNQFFDIQRFGRLLAADWQLNYKRYLYVLAGAAIGILAIFWLFLYCNINSYQQEHPFAAKAALSNYNFSFTCCLIGLMVFVASAFPDLNGTRKTGYYLLLPVSTFEKYLVQFLIYTVFGSITFVLLFWIDTQIMYWLVVSTVDNVIINPFKFSSLSQIYLTGHSKLSFILVYFSGITFVFAARLFFKRLSLIKSFLALGGILILFVGCVFLFEKIFGELQYYQVTENMRNWDLFCNILFGLSWLFFLPLAYYKLKEKQV